MRPENRLAFFAVAEAFLAKHLGGRYQPVGTDFAGSTVVHSIGGWVAIAGAIMLGLSRGNVGAGNRDLRG